MKQNKDQQKISDILKKLQASYLGNPKKTEQKAKEDAEDREFQKKLASMLGKVSKEPKKETKKASQKPSPKTQPQDIPAAALHTPDQETDVSSNPEAVADSSPTPVPADQKPAKTAPKKNAKKENQPSSTDRKTKKTTDHAETVETVQLQDAEIAEPTAEEVPSQLAIEDEFAETINDQPTVESERSVEVTSEIEIKAEMPETAVEEITVDEEAPVEIAEPTTAESPAVQDAPTPHPLALVIPLPAQEGQEEALDEATESETENAITDEATVTKEAAEPIQQPIVNKPATPARQEAIRITPRSELPKTVPQTAKQAPPKEPIIIKPKGVNANVTAPRETAQNRFLKQEQNTIVIRPPATGQTASETIVIRPRTAAKETPPQVIEKKHPNIPIKIGKEVPSDSRKEIPTSPAETPISGMKKEQNITLPAKNTATTESKPKQTASVKIKAEKNTRKATAPTSRVGEDAIRKHSGKPLKKAVADKQPPYEAQPHPEDEHLEEVLDEALANEDIIEELPMEEPEELAVPAKKPSLLRRRQQLKQQQAEQSLSALEIVRQRSGLSEDDIAMIFELGYENELGRLVGYENLKRLKTEHLKRVSQSDRKHYRTAFGYRGEEYTDAQREVVHAAYVHDRKRLIGRLLLTLLLSLLLLFVDAPHLLGSYLTDIDRAYPIVLPLLGILLFALTAWLSRRQIHAGIRSFFRFAPTPYSVCAIFPPFVLFYDLLSLFARSPMPAFNFVGSLIFLLTAVCDVLRLSCEMRTLRILSADTPKTVLAPAAPRKKKLRRGEKIVKIVSEDLGEPLYQVRSANHTVGFFRRFNSMSSANQPLTVMITLSLSLAVLVGLTVAVCSSGSLSATLSAFMTVVAVSMPASFLFSFFYPLCRANRLLARRNCALIGNEAAEELQGNKTVIFADTHLFTAQKCTESAVRNGNDFRTDLYLATLLFRKLGGTLEPLGHAVAPARSDPPVSIVRIQESGVEAMIDNNRHVLAGNAAFLQRSGIRVPSESTDVALKRTENVSLTYVAIDGVLKLRYEVEYRTDQGFEDLIRELADSNTSVAISSYDPNLNNTFLQGCRPDSAEPVKVIKQGRFEEDKPLEIVDTAAVALGKETDIAYPIHAAHGIASARRFGIRIQLIASLIGSAAVLVLTLLGMSEFLGMLSIVGYQCFWILVSALAAHSELNNDQLRLNR